jgi:serine/threonine protein kinase
MLSSESLLVGELPGRIGRYEIERRIGAGGMALTYRCRLAGIGGFSKRVVVKILHPDHVGDESYVRMFLDEAKLSARLHHVNVAQVYEVGDDHGVPYMVMEHVDGSNLADITRMLGRGQKPWGHIAWLFAGICRGLGHAHGLRDDDGKALGIVHRDVSLGNIMIGRDGVPKLIDFGIAQWAQKTNVTEVGMLKGKLHYMAPEQLRGQADHRADIYQLGVCLYWMTTGRPPFHDADPAKVWAARLDGDLKRPGQLVPGYPRELEEIITTALAVDPARRWQSADELAAMLEAFCYSQPVFATNDEAVARWVRGLLPAEMEDDREPSRSGRSEKSIGQVLSANTAKATPLTVDGPTPIVHSSTTAPTPSPQLPASPPRGQRGLILTLSIGISVLLLAVAGLLWSNGHDPDRAARLYLEESERLLNSGNTPQAREMLKRAEDAKPEEPELVIGISRMRTRIDSQSPPPSPHSDKP